LNHQKIAILGSTGSIGTQALEIIREKPELFSVQSLSANNSYQKLAEQANEFRPEQIVLCNEACRQDFESRLTYRPQSIEYGQKALETIAAESDYDVLLNSLVGFAGFMSTYMALKKGKKVALANKESLVVGGELISKLDGFVPEKLIPVDSEHSAMLQSIVGEDPASIRKMIITASGGPFRTFTKQQLEQVTVDDALNHPNWDMGAKITIDSATMMNKGLEIIEAKWLFDLEVDQIVPVIHPQSILHSIVEFVDGSSKAQLGPPDMKVPILYALTYPNRIPFNNPTLCYTEAVNMELFPVDMDRFPCMRLAIDSIREGGTAPAILNAANEIAVERFLNSEIHYIDIAKMIESSLNHFHSDKDLSPDSLLNIDKETREYAKSLLR
jgi:1-deoxy-D-xylulose-5-phosphate reductoisomerase